ncbi:MAG TPA: family 16 glycoside hydrolase [Puia sp.]|nr:family 16 glycoside hydrolase [Puia sp.]
MRKIIFTFLVLAGLSKATAQKIPMQPASWDVGKQKAGFTTRDGKDVITFDRGILWAKDFDFADGVIEADLSLYPERSFGGICFRGDEEGNAEVIYLRVPLSGRDDAIQYVPCFNGELNWQLYPEHQANYTFPQRGWVHMKIVLSGNTAQLFMDTVSTPVLTISNLRTHNRSGKIGFTCLGEETFANLTCTPMSRSAVTPVVVRNEAGLITQYQISQSSTIGKQTKEVSYPSSTELTWKTVTTDEDGLLNISKYYAKQNAETYESRSNDMVWLKQELVADVPATRKMNFDFSNQVWIFLNGQILYHGDHSFFLTGPFFLGTIDKKFITDAIYLPLKKGNNELLIAISAVANGWGIISKIQ